MKINLKVKIAKSLYDKMFGMMLAGNKDGLILKTRFGIHTFFMKNPIDVLILDNQKKVRLIKKIMPNRIFIWNPKFDTVIELPEGSIKKLNIEVGDFLNF